MAEVSARPSEALRVRQQIRVGGGGYHICSPISHSLMMLASSRESYAQATFGLEGTGAPQMRSASPGDLRRRAGQAHRVPGNK